MYDAFSVKMASERSKDGQIENLERLIKKKNNDFENLKANHFKLLESETNLTKNLNRKQMEIERLNGNIKRLQGEVEGLTREVLFVLLGRMCL